MQMATVHVISIHARACLKFARAFAGSRDTRTARDIVAKISPIEIDRGINPIPFHPLEQAWSRNCAEKSPRKRARTLAAILRPNLLMRRKWCANCIVERFCFSISR